MDIRRAFHAVDRLILNEHRDECVHKQGCYVSSIIQAQLAMRYAHLKRSGRLERLTGLVKLGFSEAATAHLALILKKQKQALRSKLSCRRICKMDFVVRAEWLDAKVLFEAS
jgi:hypothetical protein